MVDTATNASSALALIRRSARFGAVLASLPFLALLLNGQWSLVQDQGLLGGFYDAQAHAWLHGRWNVPAGTLGIEGILRHGKTYLYFGPVPALLRLPIALVTHSADGRISQLSMLAAFIVAMVFLVRLVVRIRFLVRGNRPVTGFEIRIVGVTVFALGGASVLVFLAGLAVVYYEAALWGTALTIAAFDAMIDFTTSPRPRSFVIASGFSIAAILSRPSVGAAPAVALALLAARALEIDFGRGAELAHAIRVEAVGATILIVVDAVGAVGFFLPAVQHAGATAPARLTRAVGVEAVGQRVHLVVDAVVAAVFGLLQAAAHAAHSA